jgi:hypothetical protein
MLGRCGWLLVLALSVVSSTALGDEPRSHVPVPARDGPSDPEQLFAELFRKSKLREHVENISGKNLDELLKELKAQNIRPGSPQFEEYLRKLEKRASQGGKTKLSAEEVEALQRLVKDLFPDGVPLPPDTEPKNGIPGSDEPKVGNPKTGPDWVRTPEDREALDDASRRMAHMAQQLDGWAGGARNSPALKQFAARLGRLCLENSNGRSGGLDSLLARWDRLAKQGEWFSSKWSVSGNFGLPKMPSFKLSGPGGGNGWSMSGGISGSGSGGALLTGLALAVGLLFLWRLWKRYSPWQAVSNEDGWQLGPWPVAPGAVASRTDLVRAFEYLSLLLLGRRARNWNHRAIAAQMGGELDERRRAATQLATLYERARYAPDDESLPEETVAEFRRDLCLLAGVPGA